MGSLVPLILAAAFVAGCYCTPSKSGKALPGKPEPAGQSIKDAVNSVKANLTQMLKKDKVSVTQFNVVNQMSLGKSGCCYHFYMAKVRVNNSKNGYILLSITFDDTAHGDSDQKKPHKTYYTDLKYVPNQTETSPYVQLQ